MAEYIARRRIVGDVKFESAGFKPQFPEDAENAIDLLSQIGIDASKHIPRSIHERDLNSYDRVIAMDKAIGRELKEIVDSSKLEIWKIRDPWGDDFEEYTRCAQKIMREVSRLRDKLISSSESA
jgi:protein-tyrosine-phosphatase